jgi:hypothetical protein
MNTKSKIIQAVSFVLVFALASSAGSAKAWKMPKMFSLDNTWPFRDKDKPQEGTPTRMVGAWTDTVMTQAGQKPQRGFGGRIMFYEQEGTKPILVDGQLVVYAFDETGRDPTDNKPTRRYVFPIETMPSHMSKSELGASYSFWLPWDEAGGPKTEVSLICRFEPKGGAVVTGEQTKHLLPGPVVNAVANSGPPKPPKVPEGVPSKPPRQTLEEMQTNRNGEQQAQQISYHAPAGGHAAAVANAVVQAGATPERRMTASTIQLPQNYQLPDTATLNAAMQMSRQMPANASPVQHVAPPTMNQPMGTSQPYTGTQLQQQHFPTNPPAMFPGMQAVAQSPVGSNPAFGQIQQQVYQQPVTQQPMIQPPTARAPQAPMQSWPQAPNLGGAAAAALNSPASVQYR